MATVLVTGANRGIGLAFARHYAGRGDHVIAACRQSSPALDALGVRVQPGLDVTSDEDVANLAARLRDVRIDVLVLNAGILREDDLDSLDLGDVRAQLEVNALGPLRVAHALRGNLTRGAKIALLTSRMGSIADNSSGGYYGYRMSKAALNAAGVSLARDLAPLGIAVAILHPGFVRTEMTGGAGNLTPDESARLLVERIDALDEKTTGTFWHAAGEVLPW